MSKFRVGQRVRVKYAETPLGKTFIGKVGVVDAVEIRPWWKHTYHGLDIAPICYRGDGLFGWTEDQLESATDSYDVVSWDACVWKPEHLRVGA